MATYALRPEMINAAQWNGVQTADLDIVLAGTEFTADQIARYQLTDDYLVVTGDDGPVPLGSWICRTPDGTVFVLSPSVFARRYRLV